MKRLAALAPPLALAALLVLLWSPLLSSARLLDLRAAGPASDAADYYYPLFAFLAASLKAGTWPLWCPLIFCGFPFLASQAAPFYPPNVLAAALPPVAGYNLALLSGLLCAGLTMALYARRCGLDRWSAAFGGLVFAGFGFFVGHLPEQNLIKAAGWLPLLLCGAADLNEGRARRGAALSALALGLQALAGAPQLAYYSALAWALALAAGGLGGRGRRGRTLLAAAGAVLLSCGLAAVFLLPAREAASFSYYAAADQLASAVHLRTHARDLTRLWIRDRAPYFPEGEIFIGLTGLVFSSFGAFWMCRRSDRKPRLLWVSLAVLPALATSVLLIPLWRGLPGFALFRFPVRLLLLSHVALAAFAAAGLHAARERLGRLDARLPALITALAFLAAAAESRSYIAARAAPSDPSRRTAPEVLGRIRAELGPGRLHSFAPSDLGLGLYRPSVLDSGLSGQLIANLNAAQGLPAVQGVEALAALDAVTLQSAMAAYQGEYRPDRLRWTPDPRWMNALRLQGASLVASYWELAAPGLTALGSVPDPERGRSVNLYRVGRPLPPARLVHAAAVRPEHWAQIRYALAGAFKPEREAILESDPGGLAPAAGPESVAPSRDGANGAVWTVDASAPALLALNRSWHPGWRARVDGRPAPVLKADYAFMAVPVPAGRHEVALSFRPASFLWGLALSALSAAALAGLLLA